MSSLPKTMNPTSLLCSIAGAIACCVMPMALCLNPWLLGILWQDTLPLSTPSVVVFWVLHVGGFVGAVALLRYRARLAQGAWVQQHIQRLLPKSLGLLGLTLAFFVVFLFEACFGTLNLIQLSKPKALFAERNKKIYLPDPELEHLLQPNHSGRETFRNQLTNQVIFDVEYNTDANGWRVVPGAPAAPGAEHLALLGCSYTFGKGLNDDQTLAARLVPKLRDHHVYNFGVSGWGTAQVLRLLETRNMRKYVQEEKGIAVYTFIEDHMRRALGTMRRITNFGEQYPYYTLGPDDRPVFSGTFDKNRAFTNGLYTWLSREQYIQWSGVDVPPRFSTADFRFTARLIDGIRREYLRQFPNGRFVTILFPWKRAEFDQRALEAQLRENDIAFITFPEADAFCADGNCLYELDGHPKPPLVELLATLLAEHVVKLEAPAP